MKTPLTCSFPEIIHHFVGVTRTTATGIFFRLVKLKLMGFGENQGHVDNDKGQENLLNASHVV